MKGKILAGALLVIGLAQGAYAGVNVHISFPSPEIIIRPRERVIVIQPERPQVIIAHPPVVVASPGVIYHPDDSHSRWEQNDCHKHKHCGKEKKWKNKDRKHWGHDD